jgi:hypothetical protein
MVSAPDVAEVREVTLVRLGKARKVVVVRGRPEVFGEVLEELAGSRRLPVVIGKELGFVFADCLLVAVAGVVCGWHCKSPDCAGAVCGVASG